ncbi:maintenance of telomere capping protein 1 [Abortiporus biennis]|nr:maintenance of telomere capping protein 1 [Abortiporus biennis]
MTSKPKSKQEEALQFLDDLDSFEPPPPPAGAEETSTPAPPPAGEEEVYAFIDEITQKSSEPPRSSSHLERPLSRAGTPTVRKSTERVKLGGAPVPIIPTTGSVSPGLPTAGSTSSRISLQSSRQESPAPTENASGGGSWGWGSVWSSATTALQQAKTIVDEQVKNLPKNEQAKKWSEGVLEFAKTAQLDKIGQDVKRVGLSTLTDILNVVAPPISEHEVIQVWLSHDMKGYEGVESLVYRSLTRIMEQVEGGDLIVNRGDESRPKDGSSEIRDLNPVEGLEAAIKLAQANIEDMTKRKVQPPPDAPSNTQNPTTKSYVYLRLQPFTTPLPVPDTPTTPGDASAQSNFNLQFLLYLSDPSHQITHTTITQAIPGKWLGIWDEYDWVEDLVVEAVRLGAEVIGQEYIVSRMGWDTKKGPTEPKIEVDAPPTEDSEYQ